jgi:DNA repair protein RadC
MRADVAALRRVKGLGQAKAAELAAVLEIARRALAAELVAQPVFDAPAKVREYVALHLGGLEHEQFAVMFLDNQHRLIRLETLFRGTLSQTAVYPREVARRALDLNAAAVILTHNHPSGVAEPSRADEQLTQQMKLVLALIDVRVLDHLIVAGPVVLSFAERGLM